MCVLSCVCATTPPPPPTHLPVSPILFLHHSVVLPLSICVCSYKGAADNLTAMAIEKGSLDNVTVLIVQFLWGADAVGA